MSRLVITPCAHWYSPGEFWVYYVRINRDGREGSYEIDSKGRPRYRDGDRMLPRANPGRARVLRSAVLTQIDLRTRVVRLP